MNWYNHAEKLSGKFLVKQTNVYDSAIPVLHFSSVQSLSQVWLFATPWIAACQASLSITNSQSSPKLMRIKSVMPSSHLILCRPLPLLPSIPPSIRVFSNDSTLHMKWPKYWSFSLSISPSNEHPGLLCFKFRSILPLIKMSQPQINLLSISYLRCFLQVYPSVSFFDLQASFSSSQNLLT